MRIRSVSTHECIVGVLWRSGVSRTGCPLYLLDLRIKLTKLRLYATPRTHLIKSSCVGKIVKLGV